MCTHVMIFFWLVVSKYLQKCVLYNYIDIYSYTYIIYILYIYTYYIYSYIMLYIYISMFDLYLVSSRRKQVSFSVKYQSAPAPWALSRSDFEHHGCRGLRVKHDTRHGKHTKNYGKSPFSMGKLTISMAIFNSYVWHKQRVYLSTFNPKITQKCR